MRSIRSRESDSESRISRRTDRSRGRTVASSTFAMPERMRTVACFTYADHAASTRCCQSVSGSPSARLQGRRGSVDNVEYPGRVAAGPECCGSRVGCCQRRSKARKERCWCPRQVRGATGRPRCARERIASQRPQLFLSPRTVAFSMARPSWASVVLGIQTDTAA